MKYLTLLASIILLGACAPSSPEVVTSNIPTTPNAGATLSAAESARLQAANAATIQASQLTQQSALATQKVAIVTETAVYITPGTAPTITQAQTATSETIAVKTT